MSNTFAKCEIALTPPSIGIWLKPAYFGEGIDIINLTIKFPETMRVFEELCGNVNIYGVPQARLTCVTSLHI
jgi:hypothetical protein